MREKDVEQILRKGVKGLGGLCYKFVSPGNTGVPDRIVVLPGGKVHFVELKTETGRLSKIQQVQQNRLSGCGVRVRVLRGPEEVLQFIQQCREEVMS